MGGQAVGGSFFDAAKAHTVVYTHGWELDRIRQVGGVRAARTSCRHSKNPSCFRLWTKTHRWVVVLVKRYRETFDYSANDPTHGDGEGCTADAWLESGWNVGIFYWDQFADELSVLDCEAKIHQRDTCDAPLPLPNSPPRSRNATDDILRQMPAPLSSRADGKQLCCWFRHVRPVLGFNPYRPFSLFRNWHWQSPGRYHKKLPTSPTPSRFNSEGIEANGR
jgi:hypothetical protein